MATIRIFEKIPLINDFSKIKWRVKHPFHKFYALFSVAENEVRLY